MAISFVGSASASEADGSDPVIDLSGLSLQEDDYVTVGGSSVNGSFVGNAGIQTTGYQEIASRSDGACTVQRKIMGSSPDASIACVGSGTSNNGATYIAQVWRGVDTTTPEDVSVVAAEDTIDPPAIDPVTDGAGISVFAFDQIDAISAGPSGYSGFEALLVDVAAFDPAMAAAYKILTGHAEEDPGAFTGGQSPLFAATIALRPAAEAADNRRPAATLMGL